MSTRRAVKIAAIAAVAACSYGTRAAADGASDAAAAEKLFDEARALMKKGQFAEACPKLEESNRLDPGLGTRMNLADCWDRIGRTAAAHEEFLAVAETAAAKGERERAEIAQKHAVKLETKLAKLTILVPLEHRVAGLEVRRDQTLVPREHWGAARFVDPGQVTIEARAPERIAWNTELTLVAGGTAEWTIPMLAAPPVPPAPPASGVVEPEDSNATRDLWFRRAGVGAAVVGVVGIGVGTYFSFHAKSLYNRSNEQGCDGNNQCPAPALETRERALDAGNVASVSFVLGTALAAGGVGLFVLGSRDGSTSLTASAAVLPNGSGQAVLNGNF